MRSALTCVADIPTDTPAIGEHERRAIGMGSKMYNLPLYRFERYPPSRHGDRFL